MTDSALAQFVLCGSVSNAAEEARASRRNAITRASILKARSRRKISGPDHRAFDVRYGLMHRSRESSYSITSSAIESKSGEMVRPSNLAVFWLMTSSNLVGCVIGMSAGLLPLRMRPA